MANITASAVVSAVADGSHFDYTINLTNSSSSNAAIGTFWYAWVPVPDEDFLASSPTSVSPPAGWTDNITHSGPGDGYAIQFIATNPTYDVAPGRSLSFSFQSSDAPASVNGNSPFFPGTPVGTSVVYPGAPFSDGGHDLVVTAAPTPSPSPTSTSPVTITNVRLIENRKHKVTGVVVDFSGGVNVAEAENLAAYALTTAGKHGAFVGRGTANLKLRSASINTALNEVTLTPRKAFGLAKPVQFVVNGQGLSGNDGIFIISRKGVTRG